MLSSSFAFGLEDGLIISSEKDIDWSHMIDYMQNLIHQSQGETLLRIGELCWGDHELCSDITFILYDLEQTSKSEFKIDW